MTAPWATLTHVPRERREEDQRPLDFGLIRRLLGYMRPYAAKRNALMALVVTRSVQLPLLAWAIAAVIGGPVSRMDARGILLGAAGYALLAALTQFSLRYRSRLALELGESIIYDLRNAMFRHLHRQPMSFFSRVHSGRIISRFTTDAEAVRVGVQEVLFVSMVGLGQIVISSCLMLRYDPALFLVVVGMAPVLWGLNRYFRKRLSRAYRRMQESFSRVTATMAESVSGIRVTQGFGRQDVNAGLFHDLVEDHSRYNVDAFRAAGIFLPMLEFNTQLFIALVLGIGGWRVLHGCTSIENLYQFVLLTNIFFGPLQALGNQYNSALSAMAGAERVFRLLDAAPEWSDPPDALCPADLRGRVEFIHLDFGYDPRRPVLHDISFVAEPGRSVALVGHTGGGKTSIINLIAKFYLPTRGDLLIDGVDIRRLAGPALHRRMGVVLQRNFLFSGSVLDNIRMGKPDASELEVRAVAEKLNCLDLIESLPEGFQTVVGEEGKGISLGQRQLICFARAMLADPRILILDEATSAVDAMTEARIQKALATLMRERTSFVVAHRLSTIRHADLVLVLDGGRIAERGTHEELLLADGLYTELYRQFIRSVEE